LDSAADVHTYLEGVYNTVILKDIAARRGIVDVNQLQRVARFLMSNIGNLTSIKKISDTMTSDGQRISTHAVDSYISSLSEAYLFYPIRRFDVKGRQLLKTGEKYYVADLGLRNLVLGERDADFGHMLENIVCLELIRRGWSVFVGKVGPAEIDFIAQKNMKTVYYQVSLTILDEETRRRELEPLEKVDDSYPKILLTLDSLPQSDHKGIVIKNVVDWLLEEDDGFVTVQV
jgi:predicted AAA+ superfamily ATPase